jgi:hypothetical protein
MSKTPTVTELTSRPIAKPGVAITVDVTFGDIDAPGLYEGIRFVFDNTKPSVESLVRAEFYHIENGIETGTVQYFCDEAAELFNAFKDKFGKDIPVEE